MMSNTTSPSNGKSLISKKVLHDTKALKDVPQNARHGHQTAVTT